MDGLTVLLALDQGINVLRQRCLIFFGYLADRESYRVTLHLLRLSRTEALIVRYFFYLNLLLIL